MRLVRTLQCHQAAPLTSQPLCLLHTLVSLSVCVCVSQEEAHRCLKEMADGEGDRMRAATAAMHEERHAVHKALQVRDSV